MPNRMAGRFKSLNKTGDLMAQVLCKALLWPALLACPALFAQESKTPSQPVRTVKAHDSLAGKSCVDCHRRVAPGKVKCLLAKEDLCELCHQIPVEGGMARIVKTSESLCTQCHKKDQFKGNLAHGPFAVGACTTCHDPHGGNVSGMLRSTGEQLCLECHKDFRGRLTNARFRHKAGATECIGCHSPHMSEQQHMLRSAVPDLCGKCHETIKKDQQAATVQHSPVTEAPACLNCHDPHMAQENGLLIADGLDVCLKCHDKTIKAGNREFTDMKQLLAANPLHHGPIQSRDCSACHNPHGSVYPRILKDQYLQGFYAPFLVSNYDLCFRCHDVALAKAEHTTSATKFRDGDRNLHFVHVNKTSRGRTCRSCHEVHASSIPGQISKTVPFGDWKLPIKYDETENGGSCTPGCHDLQKYDRRPAILDKP